MSKIYLITSPDGVRVACASVNHLCDVFGSVGLEYQSLLDELRKDIRKPFTKSEFAPFVRIIKDYKIETIPFVTGSRV